jgi:hypothetical protein
MKWIKLFIGTAAVVEASANAFLAEHKLEADFVETRPIQLHGSAEVGALCCINYTAKSPVVETAKEEAAAE